MWSTKPHLSLHICAVWQSLCQSLKYSLCVKPLTEHHLEFLSLKVGCTDWSESTHIKMPQCWKSHVTAHSFLVDLASVDRRNIDREEETSERVKELTNAYANSDLHKDIVYRIIEDTMKPTTSKQLLMQKYYSFRPHSSSFFRTLFTLFK